MPDTQLGDQFLYQSSLKADPPVSVSSNKRVPYVVDINQGSYSNGIITIDATSQLNGAEGFACLRDGYIMLPFKVSAKNTHASTAYNGAMNRSSIGLKCGVWNVIDSMSVELNGKSLISMGEYKHFINNLRAKMECSPDYVEKHGAENYLYPDTQSCIRFSNVAANSGDGYTNNETNLAAYMGSEITGAGVLTYNDGFVRRLVANPRSISTANDTNGWPSLAKAVSKTIANQTGRGGFIPGATAAGTISGTWYYMLKIRLVDLHPLFKELDLLANPQLKLRFRVNQGSCVITAPGTRNMTLASTTISSGTVCPIMVGSCASGGGNVNVLNMAAACEITVAWGAVVNSLEPTIDGSVFPFTTSRLYVPFVDLENPSAIISKPLKKVRYLDFYAQWFYQRAGLGVSTGQHNTAFDLQLSASVKNAKYVVLMPFAETSSGNYTTATAQQFQSPFDSAPWTHQPGSSIRNFNVRVGSQQVFDISHDYDFHSFANEFSKISAINGDQTQELSNGLIDFAKWSSAERVLVADVSRLTERDVPQSIQVMGTNGSSQGVNMLCIVAFENELTYNRLTGEVVEYTAN